MQTQHIIHYRTHHFIAWRTPKELKYFDAFVFTMADVLCTTTYKGPDFHQTNQPDINMFFKKTDTHGLIPYQLPSKTYIYGNCHISTAQIPQCATDRIWNQPPRCCLLLCPPEGAFAPFLAKPSRATKKPQLFSCFSPSSHTQLFHISHTISENSEEKKTHLFRNSRLSVSTKSDSLLLPGGTKIYRIALWRPNRNLR